MGQPLFEFEDVSVVRRGHTLLAGVTATVADEGVTVVVGPSGAGKSTLLRLCNRLDAPSAGTVRHRGRDLGRSDAPRLRRQVGMLFQRPTPLPGSVAANLRVGVPGAGDDDVERALAEVGLAGFGPRPADGLSGGEAQRVCLARSLLTRPRAMLFDEPTSALDPASARVVERLAVGLARRGTPVVWVSHDLGQLRRIADHVVVLIDGRVAQAGRRHAVLGRPAAPVRRFLAGA